MPCALFLKAFSFVSLFESASQMASLSQANATDSGSQYGAGAAHSSWGAYDMQRAPGRR